MIRAFFDRLERWADDDNSFIATGKILLVSALVFALVFSPLFVWLVHETQSAYVQCLDA